MYCYSARSSFFHAKPHFNWKPWIVCWNNWIHLDIIYSFIFVIYYWRSFPVGAFSERIQNDACIPFIASCLLTCTCTCICADMYPYLPCLCTRMLAYVVNKDTICMFLKPPSSGLLLEWLCKHCYWIFHIRDGVEWVCIVFQFDRLDRDERSHPGRGITKLCRLDRFQYKWWMGSYGGVFCIFACLTRPLARRQSPRTHT